MDEVKKIKFGKSGEIDTKNVKGGLKRENIDEKFHNIFDKVDTDKNKVLDQQEVGLFQQQIANAAKNEKLSKREASIFVKNSGSD